MSRYIDADKLRTWFESHSVWDEFTVGYIVGLIDEQPTVGAIPIEWLVNHYMVAFQSDPIEYFRMAEIHNQTIDELITLWRREQAEREEE